MCVLPKFPDGGNEQARYKAEAYRKGTRRCLPHPNSVINPVISPAISVSDLIPQDISSVDKAFDWLVADLGTIRKGIS